MKKRLFNFLPKLLIFTYFLLGMGPNLVLAMDPSKQFHVSFNDGLKSNGHMTNASLAKFLHKAYREGKLNSAAFAQISAIQVSEMTEEKKEAPWGTTQLFLVKTPGQSFVIKGVNTEKNKDIYEMQSLIQGAQARIIQQFKYSTDKLSEYPQFIFPITYLSYTDQKGQKHILSVMPQAPGISLFKLMRNYSDDPGNPKIIKIVSQAFFDIGASMARFYHKNRIGEPNKTIVHGDLHAANIFYDKNTRSVVLIDNTRVIRSVKNRTSVRDDIAFLLMKSLYVMRWTFESKLQNLRKHEWYPLYIASFVAGFVNAHPSNEKQKALDVVIKYVKEYVDPDTKLHWYIDKTIMKFSHKEYMQDVFKALKKSKILFNIDSANINKSDNNGKTLLHKAALSGEWQMVWPLISAGATVDALDRDKNTPLHEASYVGNIEGMKALIRAGADLNAKDRNDHTPKDKAVFGGNREAIELLKYYKKKYNK